MEFNEKLQELRKQKGLTQEELAQILYVSRAAVSKWESGRGYPGIESLKAIAKYFGVSIDYLLSCDEVLSIAEEDSREKQSRFCNLLFGLLDCSMILFVFLPFFGEDADGMVRSVCLVQLDGTGMYLKVAYWAVVTGLIAVGILTLMLQNCRNGFWQFWKHKVSFVMHGIAMLVFIVSLQPYAATFLFLFLVIKAFILQKKR